MREVVIVLLDELSMEDKCHFLLYHLHWIGIQEEQIACLVQLWLFLLHLFYRHHKNTIRTKSGIINYILNINLCTLNRWVRNDDLWSCLVIPKCFSRSRWVYRFLNSNATSLWVISLGLTLWPFLLISRVGSVNL